MSKTPKNACFPAFSSKKPATPSEISGILQIPSIFQDFYCFFRRVLYDFYIFHIFSKISTRKRPKTPETDKLTHGIPRSIQSRVCCAMGSIPIHGKRIIQGMTVRKHRARESAQALRWRRGKIRLPFHVCKRLSTESISIQGTIVGL